MRIDVKKLLFVGTDDVRDAFFKKAQDAGLVHFVDMNPVKEKMGSLEIEKLHAAIKVLRGLPTMEQEEITDFAKADGLVAKILYLRDTIDKLAEEKRINRLEIARIEPFGDFSVEDIDFIKTKGNRHIQFFFAKTDVIDQETDPDELIYIRSDHGLDYFVAINPSLRQYENMIEMQFEHPLSSLQKREEEIEKELYVAEQELKTYAKYNTFLHQALIYRSNGYNLRRTKEFAQLSMEGRLFVVEGWVPVDKEETLRRLVSRMNVHIEEIAVEEDEVVPTYLENTGASRIGEDLVHIYDTPSNTDKDPSLWVLSAFALFFAMIIGDGGYGLLFLCVALYLTWKFPNVTGVGKRVLKLFTILCVACVAWGALTHSFFGINFSMDSPFRKVSVLQWMTEKKAEYHIQKQDEIYQDAVQKYPQLEGITDPKEFFKQGVIASESKISYEIYDRFSDSIRMELALLIGVIHICLSLLRYLPRNWPAIGWVTFIIGGYLYVPEYLGATSMMQFLFGIDREFAAYEGQYMMIGGISAAILLGIVSYQLLGLLEVANVIQIFSDILSYLRLYALGLASAILGAVVNEVAGSVVLVLGVLLLIIGHGINMLLGVMGGVIHGLRLNYLEWYHYSFEGGGKLFNPLKKEKIE